MRRRYQTNPEPAIERARQARLSNPERNREWQRDYYQRNKDKAEFKAKKAEWYRSWRTRHSEYHRRRNQAYYATHPEYAERSNQRTSQFKVDNPRYMRVYRKVNLMKYREYARRREALKRASMVDKIDYTAILERDGYMCYLCNQVVDPSDLHFDHVIPLSKGGPHTMDNIRVTHAACNLRKNTKLLP